MKFNNSLRTFPCHFGDFILKMQWLDVLYDKAKLSADYGNHTKGIKGLGTIHYVHFHATFVILFEIRKKNSNFGKAFHSLVKL